jgi:hypothetical protein
MEAVCSSETSVDIYETSRRHIPEQSIRHSYHRENRSLVKVWYGILLTYIRSASFVCVCVRVYCTAHETCIPAKTQNKRKNTKTQTHPFWPTSLILKKKLKLVYAISMLSVCLCILSPINV